MWRLVGAIRSFLARHKRIGLAVQRLFERVPALEDALLRVARGDPVLRYQRWIAEYDTVDETDLAAMREEQANRPGPLLSLIVPVAQASGSVLDTLEQSLGAQVYQHWELWFVGEPLQETAARLAQATSRDPRLRQLGGSAGSDADAWNAALESATGEFGVLIAPAVALPPHALFLFAYAIEHHPDATLIYADEDVIDGDGFRSDHYFKPDWNEALLCSQNYLGGFVAFRRSLALAVGGCLEELDGDHAWGLFLRITGEAPAESIHHLPFVLSHRQHVLTSGVERDLSARALERRLGRVGKHVRVEPAGEASFRTHYVLPPRPPMVSAIIPSTCKVEVLRPCLEGLLSRTSYPDLEVLLAVDELQANSSSQRAYLEAVSAEGKVRVLFHAERPFNYSRVNNWAAAQAKGELVCFLNDDTGVIASDWLSEMVAHVLQNRVAAVGAMLLYPNGRIQHAGVVLGVGDLAGHSLKGWSRGTRGYHDRALVDQDISGVTAACMLVRLDVFLDVGGFDETLAIAFNDIDLCLRLRKAGWRIVWTPSAEIYHRESASIGRHDVAQGEDQWTLDWNSMHNRWEGELVSDPHYSPNLSLDQLQLWEPAFPPRISYPWRGRTTKCLGAHPREAASST